MVCLNIDENVQKVFTALLKKWKLIIAFALIGAFAAFLFTAKFTTLTYTSTIEFLAYAVDYESVVVGKTFGGGFGLEVGQTFVDDGLGGVLVLLRGLD